MAMTFLNNSSIDGNKTTPGISQQNPLTGFTIVIVVIQVIVIVVALIGNILVCTAILVYERLRTTLTNHFIFSLALSDIITASIAMPMDVDQTLKNHIGWTHGEAMCNVFVTAYLVAAPLSILNLLAVSVDRYNAITDPLHYSTIMTRKRVIIVIVTLWTYAILFTVIAMAGWPLYPTSVFNDMCHFNIQPEYSLVSSVINFVLPTIVMCVLYFRIYKVAHAHARRIGRRENYSQTMVEYNSNGNSCTTTSTERRSMTKNIKAAKTVALLVSAFLFCWMPFTLVSCVSILCGESCYRSISAPVFSVTLLIAYTNSALNPFLYAFHNRDFRESFRRLRKLKFHYV